MNQIEDPVNILREAYPGYTEAQIQEISETLDKYLEICLQVYERVRNDPKLYAEFRSMKDERKKNKK